MSDRATTFSNFWLRRILLSPVLYRDGFHIFFLTSESCEIILYINCLVFVVAQSDFIEGGVQRKLISPISAILSLSILTIFDKQRPRGGQHARHDPLKQATNIYYKMFSDFFYFSLYSFLHFSFFICFLKCFLISFLLASTTFEIFKEITTIFSDDRMTVRAFIRAQSLSVMKGNCWVEELFMFR